MFFNAFFDLVIPTQKTIDTKSISIVDTLKIENADSIAQNKQAMLDHNALIISTLNQWMSIDGNQNANRESIKMQIRLFYVAIFAALIAFLFRKNDDSRTRVINYLLILISLIYAIEVHFNDMSYRRTDSYLVKAKAVNLLVNTYQRELIWYIINYDNFRTAWEKSGEKEERWRRKFFMALKPDVEQILLYLFPFVWLLLISFFENRKKQSNSIIF